MTWQQIAPIIGPAVGGLCTLLAAWLITGYLNKNMKRHEFLLQFTNRYQDILVAKHKLNHPRDSQNTTNDLADAQELYRRLFSLVFDEFYAYQKGFLDPVIFAEWMKWRRDDYNKGDKIAGWTYKQAWKRFSATGPLAQHHFSNFLNQIHGCNDYEDVDRLVHKNAPGPFRTVAIGHTTSRRTIFLGRLIGLFALFVAVSMLIKNGSMIAIKSTILQNDILLRTAGMFLSVAGLAIVLGHNIWAGGLLARVVTVLGWVMLAGGVLAISAPDEWVMRLIEQSRYSEWFYCYAVVVLAVGAYLTIAGFWTSPGRDSKTSRAA